MSDYEIDIEKRNCAFIENIIQGSYDDNGDILLKPDSFDFANWRNPQQYKTLRMPASQAIFLSMSIVALVATTAAAIFTQRSLTRINNPWRAKGMSQGDELIQVESGIAFLRTQSGVSAAPFI